MVMKKIFGFTLIELMVTLGIFAIIVGAGLPSLQRMMNNSRLTVTTNDLVSALHVARSQAIREGVFGCVCPSSTASTALPACLNANTWEKGWISFLDRAGDCVFEPPDDVLLKVKDMAGNDGADFIVRNDNISINASNFVRFNARGTPEQTAGDGQRGIWAICDKRGKAIGSAVELSSAGSVRSARNESLMTACTL